MKLSELVKDEKLVIQIKWGDQAIEFHSSVAEKNDKGIYVTPYLHNGKILEFTINSSSGVVCNVFATNPATRQRISWKNVDLSTEKKGEALLYFIKTSGFNHMATQSERRKHDRIVVNKPARISAPKSEDYTDIIVHDISDSGISFYAPNSFEPSSHQLNISFSDNIDDKTFNINVDCTIARTTKKAGNTFNGCKIVNENKDYLLYGFLLRMKDKNSQS